LRLQKQHLKIIQLHKNETKEWAETDIGAGIIDTITCEHIKDSIINHEKSKAAEDSEEEDMIAEQEKISWNTAEKSTHTLIKFMEQTPSFSTQEVIHAHVLWNVLTRKRQTCAKQAGI
jgi:hypothetical protein